MYFLGIEAFLAIVQTGSLTKAAELLHLSQSTVSYRLKVLEQEIGTALVERGKGIQSSGLTTFGEGFVSIAERWSLLNRETELLRSRGPQLGISIGAADSLNIYVLPPLYRALSQYTPAISMSIYTQHTLESYESVERREVDVAFVKKERVVPNIIVEPFFIDEMVLVRLAEAGYTGDKAVSPEELDCRYELYMDWGPSYQIWHDHWWDPHCPSRIRLDTAALIFSLMWEPRQWTIVPQSVATVYLKSGQYVAQRLSPPPPPRACYKITHKYPKPAKVQCMEVLNDIVDKIYIQEKTI